MIDALKLGAVPRKVPLREHRYDLEAMLEAVGPRTKLVYVCHPNNPTGTMNTRAELDAYFDAVPEHVLTRPRPGLLRVHRRSGLRGRARVRQGRPQGGRAADVLEDLRAGRAPGRLRGRPGRARDGDREGAPRLRRQLGRPGRCAGEPRRTGRAGAPAQRERGRARPARADPARARSRPARLRCELPLRRGRRGLARRSSSSCSGKA